MGECNPNFADCDRDAVNGCEANLQSHTANCGICGFLCGAGQFCQGGVCAATIAGQPCARDADCGTGGQCVPAGQGFTGGYCIYGCAASAAAGDPCANGTGICLPTSGGGQLVCFRDCVPGVTGRCRTGYICLSVTTDNSLGVCYPHCGVNPGLLCGPNRCDTTSGECQSATCTSSSQCAAGAVCMTGRCECTVSTNCGTNARCYPRAGSTPGYCGCASSAWCASGRTCDTSTGRCL